MTFIRDYFVCVAVCTVFAVLWFTVWKLITPLDKFGRPKVENADDPSKGGDPDVAKERIKKIYKLDMEPADEKEIPIKGIYIYPIRGMKGIKVDVAEIQPHGIKNDRVWVVISKEKMKPLANQN